MALPPWTVELIRRSVADVARKASEPEALQRLRNQATGLIQDLPETAARGIDRVIRTAEAGKESVQRWSRKHTALAVPMLNASGVLYSDLGTGLAVPDRAIEVGQEFMRGDVVSTAAVEPRIHRRLERLLPDGGDWGIAIAASFPGALSALSLVGLDRSLVVHRHHAVRILGGVPLPDAFGTLWPVVHEVGGRDHVEPNDFIGLDRPCVILADDGEHDLELVDLSIDDAIQAVVLPVATVRTRRNALLPSAESMLRKGASLVALPGDGVAAGPPCGILMGRREELQAITTSVAWPALEAPAAIRAMMCVALEAAVPDDEALPVEARIATAIENLQDRAERFVSRLGGNANIASCQIASEEARVTATGRWRLASRQVRLTHATLSAHQWAGKLQEGLPVVVSSVLSLDSAGMTTSDDAQPCLAIDFRWLDPADDGKVADALTD